MKLAALPEWPIATKGASVLRRNPIAALITVLLGLLAGAADCVSQQQRFAPRPLPTLTKAYAAHSLSVAQAALGYPVHLRSVVTYYDPYIDPRHPSVWVSDSSGGVYVALSVPPAVPFQAGDLLEITGVSATGGYAPIVNASQARVIGHSPLPSTPPRVTLSRMLAGKTDGQWVEIEGVVHAVRESGKTISLDIASSDGSIIASTVKENGVDYRDLVDAKIRLRGDQAPLFSHQGAMTGVYLLFPNRAQVTVEEPAPPYPFKLPISPVSGLLRFTPEPASHHRVHIRGTVTLAWPGRSVCIQDGRQGLCAQTDQTTPLTPGDIVDVIGYPIIGALTPTLTRANYVAAGFHHPLPAVAITADQALLGDYQAELVQLEGQVVGQDEVASSPKIILSSQNHVFAAVLPAEYAGQLRVWKKGTTVTIIGICSVRAGTALAVTMWDVFSAPESFRILLRSPKDVVVVSSPSWWTPAHALSVLGLVAVLILMVLAWVFILKKRVEQQTLIIRRQLEEAARLELKVRSFNQQLEVRIAKRTAQLETANQELEAFCYSVSHDLRAPLRQISGVSRILMDDFGARMDIEGKDYLRRIQSTVNRMGLMVDGLLGLAKLGRQSLKLRPTELNPLVEQVISMLQLECNQRTVDWRVAPLPALRCDQVLMGQVFQNLLGNALKYSSRRPGAIIEVGSIQQTDKSPIIFVRDNGAGFDMEYAKKLFSVFQRMHTEAEFEGTGVGLATVHRIIQKHGGRVWADAAVDAGATFYFTLG